MPTARRDADDDEPDQQRDARAREDAREDVAPELVETEPVRRRRPVEPQRQFLVGWRERASDGPSDGREHGDEHDGGADSHRHS